MKFDNTFILIVFLILLGCHKPIPLPVLTEKQKELLKNYPLDKRVFMEGCLNTPRYVEYDVFNVCTSHMISLYAQNCPVQKSDSGVVNTAIGTAVGVGAAKLLLGK